MNKIFRLLLLLCTFGFLTVQYCAVAEAAPIAGRIGVGTWNTQAEFADVKVVQGAKVLYQSDFTTGMADWTTSGGTWATQNGALRQTGTDTPALAFVGSTTWTDYTLTLRARKISGSEGFLISIGQPGDATQSWWNIGGFGNTRHLLSMPGMPTSDFNGSIETGVWNDIKIELSGSNIRCYLNGKLIHDALQMLDASDRRARFNLLINSPGFGLLNDIEKNALRELAGRDVWIGDAARATFNAVPGETDFLALSPAQQAFIIRKVNRNRMTWNRGWGYDGLTWRDGYITANMDAAVMRFNSLGVFDKHLTANNSPGTPTADGGYNGQLRFGSQMTVRTCIHEINHALGVGTYWRWGQLMVGGTWTGQYGNQQLAEFDGAGAVIKGDGSHFYGVYGMGYDQDYSWENARRSILLMAAMRRDMGIADQVNFAYSDAVPSGSYALVPRLSVSSVLDVLGANPAAGTPLGINKSKGTDSQKFLLDLQADGTYRIRTALAGNRAVELPGGNADNGSKVQLWDDNGLTPQRWFLIPTDKGFFKIAPRNNNFKAMDVTGANAADGTQVQSYDYLDNFAQQWKIIPSADLYSTDVPDNAYRLTPRHAPSSALDVLDTAAKNVAPIGIKTFTKADSQKFLVDLQADGSYRIRTALADNRCVELPGGNTANQTKVQLWDDVSADSQRWYFIPTGNGYFKIAPKNDTRKVMDVVGTSVADGALVQSYDYLGDSNQQWKLTPFDTPISKMSIANVSVTEGNAGIGQARFTVTLAEIPTQTVTVEYTTANGTATAGSDYTTTSGTLTFAEGEQEKTIEVPIMGDTAIEADETFQVNLSAPTNAILTVAQATGTLVNDDLPSVSVSEVSLVEGNSGTSRANFVVKLSAAALKAVTVKYATSNGTATAGSDYIATSGTLTFASGETSKTVFVSVVGDTDVESDENFQVNLSDPTNAILGANQEQGATPGQGIIVNDDLPEVSIGDTTVTEGDLNTVDASFMVTLSQTPVKTVTVKYATAEDTAKAGSDFKATSGTLTFAPGTKSLSVVVPIVGDILAENTEAFSVNLSDASGATLIDAIGLGTINDNDERVAPMVTIASPLKSAMINSLPVISGQATDNAGGSGVARVDLYLKNSSGLYWNGTQWSGTTAIALPTALANGVWKNTTSLPLASASELLKKLANGQYSIVASAFDKAGNRQTATSSFEVDATVPFQVTINDPANGAYVSSLPMISVQSSDNSGGSGIAKVTLTLKRNSDGTYWTGSAWGAQTPVQLNTITFRGDWQRRSGLPSTTATTAAAKLDEGSYTAVALAYDKAGNSKTATSVFTVDTIAPSIVKIITPRDQSQISALTAINGIAADNAGGSGIARVDIYLQRNSDGVFWTGKAWYGKDLVALPTKVQNGVWSNAGELPIAPNYAYTETMMNGSYNVRAYCYDKAGNRSVATSNFRFKSANSTPGTNAPKAAVQGDPSGNDS
jgi:hypothetical protein